MNGFATDGNDINCRECKYGDKCNVGRGHGYRVGSCIQFEVEKKQTNAERIRNVTDEELAEWLCHIVSYETVNCSHCIAEEYCKSGRNGFIKWLKQECNE